MSITATSFTVPASLHAAAPKAKAGFFSRFISALKASREAAALREIARHQHLVDQVTALRNPEIANRNDLPF